MVMMMSPKCLAMVSMKRNASADLDIRPPGRDPACCAIRGRAPSDVTSLAWRPGRGMNPEPERGCLEISVTSIAAITGVRLLQTDLRPACSGILCDVPGIQICPGYACRPGGPRGEGTHSAEQFDTSGFIDIPRRNGDTGTREVMDDHIPRPSPG